MGILLRKRGCMVRAMCGVQLKDREIAKDLMLGFNKTLGQLAMAGNVHWHGHVFMRERVVMS